MGDVLKGKAYYGAEYGGAADAQRRQKNYRHKLPHKNQLSI